MSATSDRLMGSRGFGSEPLGPHVPDSGRLGSRGFSPAGLVLAAGAGRRLGLGPKALLALDAIPRVVAVVEALLAGGCADVTVVTGAGADDVAEVLPRHSDVHLAFNPHWATGMGSSLQRGLQAIGTGRDVLVAPVDQPGIGAEVIRRVITAHATGDGPGGITAAAHRGADGRLRRGHPVLFDARWTAAAAEAAHGDVGARELLQERSDVVTLVDCSDLDDGRDIDEPADLQRLNDARRRGAGAMGRRFG